MNKGRLSRLNPAVNWATREISRAEGMPHPTNAGKIAAMRDLAVMVAEAPDAMLDAAMDELFDLLKCMPADAILPILSELLVRRPGVIQQAMIDRTSVGGRVSHIEKSLFIAYLFSPQRVRKMVEATNTCLTGLRGRETVLE